MRLLSRRAISAFYWKLWRGRCACRDWPYPSWTPRTRLSTPCSQTQLPCCCRWVHHHLHSAPGVLLGLNVLVASALLRFLWILHLATSFLSTKPCLFPQEFDTPADSCWLLRVCCRDGMVRYVWQAVLSPLDASHLHAAMLGRCFCS